MEDEAGSLEVDLLGGGELANAGSTSLFVTVTAFDGTGLNVTAVASALIDWTPPIVGSIVFPAAESTDTRTLVTNATMVELEVIGSFYDDESDVTIVWEHYVMDEGPKPRCSYRAGAARSRQLVECDLGEARASTFCISAVVTNQAGLKTGVSKGGRVRAWVRDLGLWGADRGEG